MRQVLHESAKTMYITRAELQRSQTSTQALALQYGLNVKTIAKWRKRDFTHDVAMGPNKRSSRVLSIEEEAMCVAFRQHTLLPLDDCLYALQETLPHLSRSALHRCYQRHGISRLPNPKNDKPAKKVFRTYPIGYFHVDIAKVRTEEEKLYMFVYKFI